MAKSYEKYIVSNTPSKEDDEGPGWFMPGSKSESALRGATQAATFGFGDEAQAFLRSLASNQTYKQLRDEQRAADEAAFAANPLSYVGGALVGGAPQALGIARSAVAAGPTMAKRALGAAMGGAAQGAVHGTGQAKEVADIPREAATNAAIGGVLSAATQGLGDKAVSMYKTRAAGKLMDKIKNTPEYTPNVDLPVAPAPVLPAGGMSAVMQGPAAPLAGAALNIGRSRMMDENVPDYTTDPYSAVIHDAQQGAMGAGAVMAGRAGINLGGAALRTGADFVKGVGQGIAQGTREAIKEFPNSRVADVGRWASREVNQPTGASAVKDPFGKLTSWLDETRVKTTPDEFMTRVQDAGVAERKAAMEATKSAEGRATTNTESPIAKEGTKYDLPEESFGPSSSSAEFAAPEDKLFDLLKRRGNDSDLLNFLDSNGVDITSAKQLTSPEAAALVEKFGWNTKDFAEKVIAPHEKLLSGADIGNGENALSKLVQSLPQPNKNVVNSTRTLEEFLSNTTPDYRQSLAQPGMSTKSAIERAKNISETGRPTLSEVPAQTVAPASKSAFIDELRARSAPEYMNLLSESAPNKLSNIEHIAKFGRPAPKDAGNATMIQKLVDNGIDVTNPDALMFPKAQQIMRAEGLTENEISGVIKSIKTNVGHGSITAGSDPDLFNPLLNYFKNQ